MMLLLLGLAGGCGNKQPKLDPTATKDIALLTLDGNIPDQTADQIRELRITLDWMDDDLVQNFQHAGFRVILIKEMSAYRSEMGKLLIVNVARFKAGSRAARAFVGFGAGAASLDLQYSLLDEKGAVLAEWQDSVGSSKGATYCAQTLNKKALAKVVDLFNH